MRGTECQLHVQSEWNCRTAWSKPSGVAGMTTILAGWYTDTAKVEVLLKLGNLSEVKTELHDCVAHHRDKGEQLIPAKQFADTKEYQYTAKGDMYVQYLYLYKDGKWCVYGLDGYEWTEINVTIRE